MGVLIALCALLLTSCTTPPAGQPPKVGTADTCGYTWQRTDSPAAVIFLEHQPDWTQYRGLCQAPQIRGCAIAGAQGATVLQFRQPIAAMLADPGECNVVWHELRHALGYRHAEAHAYTPIDRTR